MIEWLVLGALALAGGASSSGSRSSSSGSRSPAPFDTGEYRRKKAADEAAWRAGWEHEVDRTRWIPQSVAHRIIETYPLPGADRTYFTTSIEKPARLKELLAEFAAHNLQHLAERKAALKPFFDSVEKNPLTDEQMDACICFDDAVQIVAAAGSGKTSTMVAKTGYVLHNELAAPEQILLLAFNKDAAAELRQRIRDRLISFDGIGRITVSTFHKFGQDVISSIGGKPSVADWLGGGAEKENEFIVSIATHLRQQDPSFGEDWDLFRTIYGREAEQPASTKPLSDDDRRDIRTAAGNWVKSEEERMIADWLFFHHVRYEYERPYGQDTRTREKRQYKPDFFYPDAQLYHEHFAINEKGQAPAHFGDYLAGVRWKRQCHEAHGTHLIETTSYGIRREAGLAALNDRLREHGIEPRFDPSRPPKGRAPVTDLELAGLIRSFQQHVKGGFQTTEEIRRRLIEDQSEKIHEARAFRFLHLYDRIAAEWERRLQATRSIDFDDMLIQAAEHIENDRYESRYTMIFADEFQDSSRARLRLLKALLAKTDQRGHLCVVGDDWQSINRFAGADLTVMTEFKKSFPHSSRLDLGTTFRCPAGLCEASSAFVKANPHQLDKSVQTTNTHEGPALAAFASGTTEEAEQLLFRHLTKLYQQIDVEAGASPTTVLLLGRYNHNKPRRLDHWLREFRDRLRIDFRTVHRSKGLEADYVMILGMTDGDHGFPSRIADDALLTLAMPDAEKFPHAEERRVFYVALTRAKRQVRIYTSSSSPSRFLMEMVKERHISIRQDSGRPLEFCPKCSRGVLNRREGGYGTFDGCGSCDFTRSVDQRSNATSSSNRVSLRTPMAPGSVCPTCGTGRMMERAKARYRPMVGCSGYPACKTTAPLIVQPAN